MTHEPAPIRDPEPRLRVRQDPAETLRKMLIDGIESGRWSPRTRLPTERSLCADFGVSRSALRRLLQELRARGLIVQRVGSGTFVSDAPPRTSAATPRLDGAHLQLAAISPSEIMEARLLLEPNLVDLIVSNASMQDFEQLQACCERSEQAETLEEFERWDSQLHEQMALATHNAVFVSVFKLIAEVRNSGEWGVLKKKVLTAQRRVVLQDEHRQIVQALKRRDADTARRKLFEHLSQARANLLWRA